MPSNPIEPGAAALVEALDRALELGDVARTVTAVKRSLSDLIRAGRIELPARYFLPRRDTYARRLLHRDPERGYSAVVMTWGPGQGTLLHDHAGIWCVEGVISGEMEVLQYELLPEGGEGGFRFAPRGRVHAFAGSSGALIPPFEYHILRNALPDRPTVTLHVYGGDMERCSVFEPAADGSYRKAERTLAFHD